MKRRDRFFYGYIILIVTWCLYFCVFGTVTYGASVINANMQMSLGIKERYIGMASTLSMLLSGLMGPVTGHLIARKGVRKPFAAGAVMVCAASLLLATAVKEHVAFLLFYGVVMGMGIGLAGLVSIQSIVNEWFDRKKAMAMAIVLTAGSVSGFITPQIAEKLTGSGTWTWGWYYTCALSALALLLAFLFLKNGPEEIGQYPDGLLPEKRPEKAETAGGEERPVPRSAFFRVLANYMTRNALYYSFIAYIVIFLRERGHTSGVGASVLSVVSILSLVGRLIAGAIPERRIPANITLGAGNILMGLGTLVIAIQPDTAGIWAGAGCFGIGLGFVTVALPLTVSRIYGKKRFPVVNGRLSLFNCLLSAGAPSAVGYAAEVLGGYALPFGVTGALAVLGGAAVLTIRTANVRGNYELS